MLFFAAPMAEIRQQMKCFTCGDRTPRTLTFNDNYRMVAQTLSKAELILDGAKKYVLCRSCMRKFQKWMNFLAANRLCKFQDRKFPKARRSNIPIVTETRLGFIGILESGFSDLQSGLSSAKEQRLLQELKEQKESFKKREHETKVRTDRQYEDAYTDGAVAMRQTITAHHKRNSTNEGPSSTSSRATKARTANVQYPPSSPPTDTQDYSDGECIVACAKRCGWCNGTIVKGTRAVQCKIYRTRFLHKKCADAINKK